MIKKVDVFVSFPQGAVFTTNVSTYLYMIFMNFVKTVSCICPDEKCITCTDKEICRYNSLSGQNFSNYPGIILKQPIFEKKEYRKNEQKKFTFYMVGNQEKYAEYILLFFEQLHQQMQHQFFYLKETKSSYVQDGEVVCSSLRIKTPIAKPKFIHEYNEMVQNYNKMYETEFECIHADETWMNMKEVQLIPFKVKTTRKYGKGYIGMVSFSHCITLNKNLVELGIGCFNYQGGGEIEIENKFEM